MRRVARRRFERGDQDAFDIGISDFPGDAGPRVVEQPIETWRLWRVDMSDQIIVATFNSTDDVYDAAGAMKQLKNEGAVDFRVKAGILIKKDDRGNVSLLESKERKPWGTAVGTTAGALIGLISGAPARRWERRWARPQG
jgi:hypothetical protein